MKLITNLLKNNWEGTLIKMKAITRENIKGYSFITPSLILLITFILIPFIYAFSLSLFRSDGLGVNTFVGLQNFIDLFTDERFGKTFKPLFIYCGVSIPLTVILPFLGAKLIYSIRNEKIAFFLQSYIYNINGCSRNGYISTLDANVQWSIRCYK